MEAELHEDRERKCGMRMKKVREGRAGFSMREIVKEGKWQRNGRVLSHEV